MFKHEDFLGTESFGAMINSVIVLSKSTFFLKAEVDESLDTDIDGKDVKKAMDHQQYLFYSTLGNRSVIDIHDILTVIRKHCQEYIEAYDAFEAHRIQENSK